jgi:preprotein translocase subunit SecA
VQVALASLMPKQSQENDLDNRRRLMEWSIERFPTQHESIDPQFYISATREEMQQHLRAMSERHLPTVPQADIDKKLEESLSGAERAEAADAQELVDWYKEAFKLEIKPEALTGQTRDEIRQNLWNFYDHVYRPEMRRMERNLLLEFIDSSWKMHLLSMDHLRSGIGLYSYAQVDPKIKYKQEGMKLFEQMLESLDERVCETVFRLEEAPEESMNEAMWAGAQASQQPVQLFEAPKAKAPARQEMQTNRETASAPKAVQRKGPRIGRNDPCPCGSGKKYKHCHLKAGTPETT